MKRLIHALLPFCLAMPVCAENLPASDGTLGDPESRLQSLLQQSPELILQVLEDNPVLLANLVDRAMDIRSAKAEEEQWQAELANPKVPLIEGDRPVRGAHDAPVTIVEYSDFECPYCQAASSTLQELLSDYDGAVRLVYKHNPLSFHPSAEPAARYFEAIALQDEAQAWQFHDQVFDLQHRLAEGTDTLEMIAGELDIDQQRLAEDLYGEIVEQRLKSDRMEAERFGFDGTPAFLVNGISIIGNRPKDDFERIIEWFL